MRSRKYADEHRSVVSHLVRDEPLTDTPDAQRRAAYVAGVADAIPQMERMERPPLADLASAWRRVSYSQADAGQTGESIASIERSIEWARRDMESDDAPDAGRQLAESLVYAALLQQRRGRIAAAGDFALEAVRRADTLPASARTAIERTPTFIRALWLAARQRGRAGDVEGARVLLRRSIDLSRAMGKTAQLRSTLDLVWLERSVRDEPRVTATCAEAKSLGAATVRLVKLCGPEPDAAGVDREASVATQAAVFERQLRLDPERYRFRLQLARLKLQLARFADEKQDRPRARELVQEARDLADNLLRADPENLNLQLLMTRIDRVGLRVAAQ